MGRILVTGLTGNVGREVAESLRSKGAEFVCGVRNIQKAEQSYGQQYSYVRLDYHDPNTFEHALEGVDRIFLNYPPETLFSSFHGFIQYAQQRGVRHITYLSVKDVQFLPFVPHYKNERFILKSGISFTFLRAGYFTQNLNMFLLDELVRNDRIYVPAGRGKTSFVDLRDIGEAATNTLLDPDKHRNQKYVLTGQEALDFFRVAEIMTGVLGRTILYTNPTSRAFKEEMIKKGLEPKYVNLVAGLHTFTRLGMAKGIRRDLIDLIGRNPISVEQYVRDYQHVWKDS